MKNRVLSGICSLLAVLLLTVTVVSAQTVGQSAAPKAASGELGVFALVLEDGDKQTEVSAFLAMDGNGRVCLVTDRALKPLLEKNDPVLIASGYRERARVLGYDDLFAYLQAEDLEDYLPLEMTDDFAEDAVVLFMNTDSGALASRQLNLTKPKLRGKHQELDMELPAIFLGAPVLRSDTYGLIGTMSYGEGTNGAVYDCRGISFPEEYTQFTREVTRKEKNSLLLLAAAAAVICLGAAAAVIAGKKKKEEAARKEQEATLLRQQEEKPRGLQLVALNGIHKGKAFPLAGVLCIGRTAQCGIRFPDGTPGISSEHCMVFLDGEGNPVVKDLGSTYGTYLRSEQLAAQACYSIKPGDELTLAWDGQRFRLEQISS